MQRSNCTGPSPAGNRVEDGGPADIVSKEKKMDMITGKQRLSALTVGLFGLAALVLPVWMIARGDFKLWAAELALLCAFAVALRSYALEWRKRKDENEHRTR